MSLTSYETIIYPVVSEKGTILQEQNKYIFRVHSKTNKIEIKRAVQDIFKVKVKKVNTISVHGKEKRMRYKSGFTSSWKKAIVTLRAGEKIELI